MGALPTRCALRISADPTAGHYRRGRRGPLRLAEDNGEGNVFNDQVDAISKLDLDAVIGDGKRQLSRNPEVAATKFVGQADLICVFQKPGSEHRMNLHSGIDDLSANSVDVQSVFLCEPLRSSASSAVKQFATSR